MNRKPFGVFECHLVSLRGSEWGNLHPIYIRNPVGSFVFASFRGLHPPAFTIQKGDREVDDAYPLEMPEMPHLDLARPRFLYPMRFKAAPKRTAHLRGPGLLSEKTQVRNSVFPLSGERA